MPVKMPFLKSPDEGVQNSELKLYFSDVTATRGFAAASILTRSFGRFCSTSPVTAQLFGDADMAFIDGRMSDHVCLFVRNGSASATLYSARFGFSVNRVAGCELAVGVDPRDFPVPENATTPQAHAATSDPFEEPEGVRFRVARWVGLGDIGPRQCRAIWLRRTGLGPGAPLEPSTNTWHISGASGLLA